MHGPWKPLEGQRCNPAKLLVDPYVRAIAGPVKWNRALFPYPLGGDDLQRDGADSAPFVPRSIVVDDRFDWGADRAPRRKLHETIVYELHVKGFTSPRSAATEVPCSTSGARSASRAARSWSCRAPRARDARPSGVPSLRRRGWVAGD